MRDAPRSPALQAAYAFCRSRVSHYENFPVGSVLFPRSIRDHFNAVYCFARTADDFADEGVLDPAERLRRLDAFDSELARAANGTSNDPAFIALGDTMTRFEIPVDPFRKLLSAFRQDVTTQRYERFEDVLDYCTRSANPVGEIVLRLFRQYNAHTAPASDAVCTALQLANFWQDVGADFAKGRIYLPQEDMLRFGVDESIVVRNSPTAEFRAMIKFQVDRTEGLFGEGAQLVPLLHGRLRREIAAVVGSGRAVLDLIKRHDFDVLTKSNRLSTLAKGWILVRGIVWPFA